MISRKGSGFDIILVSGEPWVDHPMSPAGIIARVLEAAGYAVGIIDRPDWKTDGDFVKLGAPRLFFGVTSGSIDSMLVNYTPLKRRREKDEHAPYASAMPDRAVIVYCNILRRLFPGTPLVIGGIEASLRRFAHYDYWDDAVRRSILLDSRADILVYGPGELQAVEIARRLDNGEGLDGIPGTAIVGPGLPPGFRELPSYRSRERGSGPVQRGAERLFQPARPRPASCRALRSPICRAGIRPGRPRPDLRSSFHQGRPRRIPRVPDGPILGRHPPRMFRAVLFLRPGAPPGRPDRVPERGLDP